MQDCCSSTDRRGMCRRSVLIGVAPHLAEVVPGQQLPGVQQRSQTPPLLAWHCLRMQPPHLRHRSGCVRSHRLGTCMCRQADSRQESTPNRSWALRPPCRLQVTCRPSPSPLQFAGRIRILRSSADQQRQAGRGTGRTAGQAPPHLPEVQAGQDVAQQVGGHGPAQEGRQLLEEGRLLDLALRHPPGDAPRPAPRRPCSHHLVPRNKQQPRMCAAKAADLRTEEITMQI